MNRSLLAFLLLASCSPASPQFSAAPETALTVGGADYRVFVLPDRAQVIRVSRKRTNGKNPDSEMAEAIELASGCEIDGALIGDAVVAIARLDC